MINKFKKPIIIFNPLAGEGKAKKLLENYYNKLLNNKLFEKIDLYETKSKKDTIVTIKNIHKEKKHDLLICIGGDGSISTICNGIMNIPIQKRLPVFPLPSGSGNSLLRDFNILNIDDAINNYKNQKPKLFDVMLIEELKGKFKWYCVNVIGMGFISDIADFVVNKGKKYGALSYVLGTVLALGRFKPYKTKIIYYYKNKKMQFNTERNFFTTLSNTKYTGGKIMIAPEAKYDDGLIDVIILYEINRFLFLKGFLKTGNGNHIKEKGCLYFKANKLEIFAEPEFKIMPDGELEGVSPIRVSVIPKQVKFIV